MAEKLVNNTSKNNGQEAEKLMPPKKLYSELCTIIPAAGAGHRMKSYGPKALIQVGKNITLIERQIKNILSVYPGSEIIISVGFEADRIIQSLSKYKVRFVLNPIYDKTNVLYSLGLALRATISEEVLVVYGDLVFNKHAIKNIRGVSKLIAEDKGMFSKNEVGLTIQNKRVTNLSFGLDTKWAQIAYITGKELNLFKDISMRKDTSQWFGYEGLNYVIDNGGELNAVKPKLMDIFEIDRIKDLKKIKIS